MENYKKSRGQNFTKEDELILLRDIRNYKKIIECKISNKITNSEKEKAWESIKDSYNSKTGQNRTKEQVRGKYDNMKTRIKKEMAVKNTYLKILGPLDLDPITEAMLEIIIPKSVSDLQNNEEMNNMNFSECSNSTNTIPMISWNEVKIENISSDEEIIRVEQTSGKEQTSCSNIIQEEILSIEEKEKVLNSNNETNATIVNNNETSVKECINLEKNMPNELKKSSRRPLRNKRSNPFFTAKLEFLKEKTRLVKNTNIREEEIHRKRMKLMDMELLLKERELLKTKL